ncbi:MAG: hypothetical protein F4089_06165 [Gammaproteobacteria bacterium]|nr:hypothetical protein [Gammaproteobacteria bacterium]
MEDSAQTDIQGWDAIDDHRTGTAGDRQTSEWLIAQARAAGLVAQQEGFGLSRWILESCTVRHADVVADGVPMFDGGTTGAQGVSGRLSLLEGEAAPDSATIGLGSFGNAAGTANRALADARKAGSHRALVAVSNMDPRVTGLALNNADRFRTPFGPPVLQVATEHERWLRGAAARAEPVTLTAHVGFETATGTNVVCRLPGREPDLAPLAVLTPKSAWWVCTAERGGGIAVWLALLRHFAANRPRRDVLFVATSGHELGHLGLDHFLTTNARRDAHAWMHLGANFAAMGSRIRLQASDADLLGTARSALAAAAVSVATTTPLGERPGGEARNIHDLGGRYVSLLGTNPWFHHPDDRWPVTVDLDRTRRIIDAARVIASALV